MGTGDSTDVLVRVVSSDRVNINGYNVYREYLGQWVESMLKTKADRWIFVVGEPDLRFGDVAKAIDAAAHKADYVVVLTSSVVKQAAWNTPFCIDPNIPLDYFAYPRRR